MTNVPPEPATGFPYRAIVRGDVAPPHAAVERALELLEHGSRELDALAADLAAGLEGGAEDVHVDRFSRLLYSTDASIYEMEPVAVVYPRSTSDVQHVILTASRLGVPVLTRGGGTSLSGQCVNHAIVLDCSRYMNRVLEIDAERGLARVEPGVVIDQLSKAGRAHGLHYPIDPSTKNRATIGGGIGNNSCGAHSVIYGKTIDQVVSLTVVLSDGRVATFEEIDGPALAAKLEAPGLEGELYRGVRRIAAEHREEIAARFPRIQRRVSGYNLDEFTDEQAPVNLARIIVGSEGTLAAVTEAVVRLQPLPAVKGVAALHFDSVVDACRATPALLAHGPSAVELVDRTIIDRCRESIGYARLVEFVRGEPGALLLVECYGEDEASLRAHLDRIEADATASGLARACVTTTDAGEQARMWRMREAGLGILMSVKGDAKPIAFVEDTAVPPEVLADFVERFDAIVRNHGTTAAYYGHASVGCLHIRPLVNIKDAGELEQIKAIASEIADLVLEFGGSLSGEHGDGILRGVFAERMFGSQLIEAFRDLKRTFDPLGLLNPGKIIDTPAFDDHLRLNPRTVNLQPSTHLDWSLDGGIARAVELCNGQGACRKDDGAMCPSYMVTRDEEHSTRGRANLLRQALNGVLPAEELYGERIHAALDLCVECKACKAECPSGVDLAKLKYEVLTKHHEEHGLPFRARLFGHAGTWSRWASRLGPLTALVNVGSSLAPVRLAMHRWPGIHRQRPLPRIARRSFRRWFAQYPVRVEAPRGDVVLFDDTFTNANHPEVGRAAVRVLEALGYRVVLVPKLGCCGRPLISKGQLGTARAWARANVDRLLPYAERGVPVVGTEPSCLLTLRDEYPELLRDEASHTVAGAAQMIEELIASIAAAEPEVGAIFGEAGPAHAVLHGHCHQKALTGMDATLAMLGLVPGLEVSLVDSGCCGMAGSFGFETEHYQLSRAMGARSLFPAVEAAPADAEVLITGVSCRQQIGHFTSRQPRHVVEFLADRLEPRGSDAYCDAQVSVSD